MTVTRSFASCARLLGVLMLLQSFPSKGAPNTPTSLPAATRPAVSMEAAMNASAKSVVFVLDCSHSMSNRPSPRNVITKALTGGTAPQQFNIIAGSSAGAKAFNPSGLIQTTDGATKKVEGFLSDTAVDRVGDLAAAVSQAVAMNPERVVIVTEFQISKDQQVKLERLIGRLDERRKSSVVVAMVSLVDGQETVRISSLLDVLAASYPKGVTKAMIADWREAAVKQLEPKIAEAMKTMRPMPMNSRNRRELASEVRQLREEKLAVEKLTDMEVAGKIVEERITEAARKEQEMVERRAATEAGRRRLLGGGDGINAPGTGFGDDGGAASRTGGGVRSCPRCGGLGKYGVAGGGGSFDKITGGTPLHICEVCGGTGKVTE